VSAGVQAVINGNGNGYGMPPAGKGQTPLATRSPDRPGLRPARSGGDASSLLTRMSLTSIWARLAVLELETVSGRYPRHHSVLRFPALPAGGGR